VLVVALTGGIGSGKSTVAEHFSALGVPVIDADAISHELTAPGSPGVAAIADAFGPSVLGPNGSLDRGALREIVFSTPPARARLEAILHPRIRERMLERLSAVDAPYAILVIPLLFETGQADLADRILVVDLPEGEQIRRVRSRSGLKAAEIRRILSAQATRSLRLEHADDVIDNRGDRAALSAQIEDLHRRYLDLART
jgi:dephospho-CoA kinase